MKDETKRKKLLMSLGRLWKITLHLFNSLPSTFDFHQVFSWGFASPAWKPCYLPKRSISEKPHYIVARGDKANIYVTFFVSPWRLFKRGFLTIKKRRMLLLRLNRNCIFFIISLPRKRGFEKPSIFLLSWKTMDSPTAQWKFKTFAITQTFSKTIN